MKNSCKLIISTLFILQSCGVSTYIDNTHNTPIFEGKDECVLSGYIDLKSIELQTAYSVSDHIGFTADLYGSLGIGVRSKYGGHNKGFVEGGIGYFTNARDENFKLEVFTGYGYGHFKGLFCETLEFIVEGYEDFDLDVNYHRFFFQPILWYKESDLIYGGISARFTYSIFTNYDYTYQAHINSFYYNDSYSVPNLQCFTIDPLIFLYTGGKNFKFNLQLGYSIPFSNTKSIDNDPLVSHPYYLGIAINLGVSYTFHIQDMFK